MFFKSRSTKFGILALVARLVLAVLIPTHAVSALAESKAESAMTGLQTAVFAGGCFWGVDAVFKHVKGVASVESGYAGGSAGKANYKAVSSGRTGHAEAVRVRFNPAQVTYPQLLQVFFIVAHDPTQLNRQGPDVGSQYRSAIFFTDTEQQKLALAQIQQLSTDRTYGKPVVTQVTALQQFNLAEPYHQNYLALHPTQPYIVINDQPKIEHLRKQFPALYQ
ncbi:peptide-methionine (S)-S-oxide reductase MsrA [Dechloromonas hortensis]|uniref:peptide-methionine (S)-S-oxide reductase MsrA n=1 Tax=Dechloromonas hortensis TaxID=337779 RepID=UPI000CC27FAB|nr:peptide-methionine (S)-S-oxide reductase MsrA [Dechloromonas hortensis]PKO89348.1 MAG: peptide-methionine (S)-S-oxide reductase [Betaproteobacteria bacterium HGW-Betaproteobacteria-12]